MQAEPQTPAPSLVSQLKELFSTPFVWLMGFWGLMIMLGYAFVRPAVDALFNKEHGPKKLPFVWLAMVVMVGIVVAIYNHFSRRFTPLFVFRAASYITGILFALLLLGIRVPFLSKPLVFVLYMVKDCYIMVFVEIFWTFASLVSRFKAARFTYGFFLLMSSIGQFIGHYYVGKMDRWLGGTERVVWVLLPILVLGVLVVFLLQHSLKKTQMERLEHKDQDSLWKKLKSVRGNSYLLYILLLVGVVQIVLNLLDFQYSYSLDTTYPTSNVSAEVRLLNTTLQTEAKGKLHSIIDVSCFVLNLATGFVLKFLGVATPLLGTPILVSIAVLFVLFSPSLLSVGTSRIVSKTLDFSIFKSSRELLYLPLTYTEKVQGKALIDVFVYRFGKAFAALLLFPLLKTLSQDAISVLNLILIGIWVTITVVLLRRYYLKIKEQKQEASLSKEASLSG